MVSMKCLRCGFCCYAWEVRELNKPEKTFCKYLKYEKHGEKIVATCTIYHKKPKECRIFNIASEKICPIGKVMIEKGIIKELYKKWLKIKKKNRS